MSALERAAEDAEAEAAQRSIRRGRLLVLCALVPYILIRTTLTIAAAATSPLPTTLASVAIEVALLWKVWRGSGDARRVLGLLCALSAALSALVLFDGPRNDTPILVASLASSGFAFCVFVFSEDARSFLLFRAASRDGGSAHR